MFFILSWFVGISKLYATCVDSDKMPHSVASDEDLHCLLMSLLGDARHKRVKYHVNTVNLHYNDSICSQ